MRTSRKSDFRKLKKTLVASTYPGQRPQCPSLSRHVLLTDIIVSIIVDAFSLTLSLAVIVNVFTVIVNFITYVYSIITFKASVARFNSVLYSYKYEQLPKIFVLFIIKK